MEAQMPYVKYTGPDEREVPDLRLVVKPNHTYEVDQDHLPGLLCQEVWEKAKKTESAPRAEPQGTDDDLASGEAVS
jgi:hypothetical protein